MTTPEAADRRRVQRAHNAAGRLLESEPTATRAWAAAGSGIFLKWAVPALQAAGKNVVALIKALMKNEVLDGDVLLTRLCAWGGEERVRARRVAW